eukprot:gnl/MRDRNA2_/MRDRNA2_95915_c0_seq1.p1 gnl/MRDRNA2_/MRDRNA2_95915_c0~~gnl/MRDRNA2_/MRDRNA2_95915_c0_seq1.p1  ORF type:complete len:507 (-),score=91.32 gnl/MRDRNA2_/MRDRNA2_95915_c0_seq1:55-1575(-)
MSASSPSGSGSPARPSILSKGREITDDEEAVERLQAALKKEVERVLRYNFHDVCVANNEEMLEDLTSVLHLARSAWDDYCQCAPISTSNLDPEQRSLIQRFETKQEKLSELTNELIESKRTMNASREAYETERSYLEELHWSMGLGKLRAPRNLDDVDDSKEFTPGDQEAYNRAVISAMESGLKAKHKTELAALRLANIAEQRGLQSRIDSAKTSKAQALQEHAIKISKLVQKLEKLGVPLSSADRGELATAYRYLGTRNEQKRVETEKNPSKAVAPGEKDRGNNKSRMSLVTKRMSAFENAPRSSVLATLAGLPAKSAAPKEIDIPPAKGGNGFPHHSGTAMNVSKDFKPSRDPLQGLSLGGSLSPFTSRQDTSLTFTSASSVARDLYTTPMRKPKPRVAGADIPRVGCPPRRRCVTADAAKRSLNESTMTRASVTRGSVSSTMPSARASVQSMKFGAEQPQYEEPPDEEEPESPYWVTQPTGLLKLGPCHNPTLPGYCLKPANT